MVNKIYDFYRLRCLEEILGYVRIPDNLREVMLSEEAEWIAVNNYAANVLELHEGENRKNHTY